MADFEQCARFLKIGEDTIKLPYPVSEGNYTRTNPNMDSEKLPQIDLPLSYENQSTTVSLPSGTNVDVPFYSESAQEWLVWSMMQVSFQANSSGVRSVYPFKTHNDGNGNITNVSLVAQNRIGAAPAGVTIITATPSTFFTREAGDTDAFTNTINLRLWQNSGSTLTATVDGVFIKLQK